MDQVIDITPKDHTSAPTKKKHGREGGRWSRSGCLTCKKRRKRCDETKPRCNNCARLGKTCEGYGSMWAEPLSTFTGVSRQTAGQKRRRLSSPGYSAGDSIVSTCLSTPSPILPDDSASLSGSSSQTEDSRPTDSPTNTTLPITPYVSNLTSFEAHYLQYHVEQGSKLLANLENDENPLRSLLIPRALSSPLLMKAMCAMSAIHLANRSDDSFRAQTAATNYYIQTMRGLRATLVDCQDGGGGGGRFPDDAILAVSLLCKYEIVRGSVKQWVVHLDALQKLVISRGGYASLDRDTAEFLLGFFMYAHNMAKITNRRHVTGIIPGADCIQITKLDIYIGYTEEIIKICARIADLPSLDSDLVDLEVSRIDESLRTWTHTARKYIIPQGITPASLLRLQMVAECFRDAAYMYLHSVLERSPPLPPWHHHSPNPNPNWTISTTKSEALQRCLSRINSFNLDPRHCEYSALTFPLFIAGCESRTPEEREVVMRSLGRLETNFGIGNVKRAKEVLNVLWDGDGTEDGGRKVHWLDVLEGLQWDLILA